SDFFDFLENRRGKLDGVVISGGEPTLQRDLPDFAAKIKQLGFAIKIDTNGSNFDMIEEIYSAGNLDALGVDYKAPQAKYPQITGCTTSMVSSVVAVISFAVANNIKLDLRTTVHQSLLNWEDLKIMRRELNDIAPGVEWILQQFNPADILDENLLTQPTYGDRELLDFAQKLGNTRVRSVGGLLV
ncbi:MAG: radical SAM protein, partial [Victivallaceae bacterium]